MPKLLHYLRSERRRAGLSQKDVAALMGLRSVSQISRYEQYRRCPPLRVVLTYEVIFGKPVSVIFEGSFIEVQQAVRARTLKLLENAESPTTVRHQHRDEQLRRIAAG